MKVKIVFKYVLCLCSLASVFLFCGSFRAIAAGDGSLAPGVDPTGGGCGDWWDTCYGYSWQTYKVNTDLPSEGVRLHYTKETGGPVYIKGCKKGYTIYNYGFETYGSAEYGKQVSTQRNKNGTQAQWYTSDGHLISPTAGSGSGGLGAYGSDATIKNYTTPTGYVTMAQAKAEFDEMKEYIKTHPSEAGNFSGSGISWDDVGAFCWYGVDEQEFTLKRVAVDTAGTVIATDGGKSSDKVKSGNSATVSAGTNSYYVFKGWRSDRYSGDPSWGYTTSYTVNSLTDNITVYAVYEQRSIKVEGKNIYNDGDINDGDITRVFSQSTETIERTILNNSTSGDYHFIGWKKSNSAGTGNILTDTSSSTTSGIYVSDGNKYTYGNSNNKIYLKINAVPSKVSGNQTTVYAYYAPSCKLTISQGANTTITVNRTSTVYGVSKDKSLSNGGLLYKGDVLEISFSVDAGYTLKTHTVDGVSHTSGGTKSVTGSGGTCNDVTIAATAEENVFEGMSRVCSSSGGCDSTGWVKENTTKTRYIENCDPINGCKVNFDHKLRRTSGSGSVKYSITRTYFGSSAENIKTNQNANPTSNNGNGVEVRSRSSSEVTLRPGQVVCEKLIFKPSVTTTSDKTLTVCASALGNAQAGTLLEMKVKNESVVKYNEYRDSVYAKPGDVVEYRAVYNPVLQYAYNIYPQKLSVDGDIFNNPTNENGCTLANYTIGGLFFNCQAYEWRNAFIMYSETDPATSDSVFAEENYNKYTVGDTTQRVEYKKRTGGKITSSDVGKKLIGYAETNKNSKIKTTPKQITFTSSEGFNLATVDVGSIKDSAEVIVPYNFKNDIKIETEGGIVYAGEVKTITSLVTVGKKTNNVTTDGLEEYATNVPKAEVKLELKYHSSGGLFRDINTTVSADPSEDSSAHLKNIAGGSSKEAGMTFGVIDYPAGTTVEVTACVWPATSGADTNWNDADGDHKWACSDPVTFTIAKKPSFQVLGGSVYSNGAITAPAALKNNLLGVEGYSYSNEETEITGDRKAVAFGSWAEQAVVSNGTVIGLASGAATGLNVTLNGSLVNGIEETMNRSGGGKYCTNRVTLSFANYFNTNQGCTGTDETGMLGTASSAVDRVSLISYILGGNNVENIKLTADSGYTIGSMTIGKDENGKGITKVITTDNAEGADTITIAGNLTYSDGIYSSLDSIPRFIIYADNINIACNVTKVDAVLIANNKIDTCPDSDGEKINESKNRNQLIINGLIIANLLDLNRTFGASVGINSGVPAEIINYDTSTILWSMNQAATDDYAGMTSVYQHEIAPRY